MPGTCFVVQFGSKKKSSNPVIDRALLGGGPGFDDLKSAVREAGWDIGASLQVSHVRIIFYDSIDAQRIRQNRIIEIDDPSDRNSMFIIPPKLQAQFKAEGTSMTPSLVMVMRRVGVLPDNWKARLDQFLDSYDPYPGRTHSVPAYDRSAVERRDAPLGTKHGSKRTPVASPISSSDQGPPVFISYSREDQEYVKKLVAHLRNAGVDCWIDKSGIDYGDRWEKEIRTNLDACRVFVVVMTPASADSRWVSREISRAEKLGKHILPVLLKGEEFFRLNDLQYELAIGGSMPSKRWVERVQALAGRR